MSKNTYVIHFCKNPKCNNAWIDVDLTNAKTRPPTWKYCEKCCKELGFVNLELPPKKKLTTKQQDVIIKNQFTKRKKFVSSNFLTGVNEVA